MNKIFRLWLLFAVVSAPAALAEQAELVNVAPGPVAVSGKDFRLFDAVYFGNRKSETAHDFASDNSRIQEAAGLGESCRVVLPAKPEPKLRGGSLKFTVKCDPEQQNYLTVKFWGNDVGNTTLYLYCNGLQTGIDAYDWPPLDRLNWRHKAPAFKDRFFYTTYMIPYHVTHGKQRVTLEIVSKGYLYSYASSRKKAVHEQKEPSRGIYAAYTHVDPFFEVPEEEARGEARQYGTIRSAEGRTAEQVFVDYAKRMLRGIARKERPRSRDLMALGLAYGRSWSDQYRKQEVLEKIIRVVDSHVAESDHRAMGWDGHGELAEALYHTLDAIRANGYLEETFPGQDCTRREAYARFFRGGIDYRTEHRGGLTNQDIYIITSVYRTNRLLKEIAPETALPEKRALKYVYECIGLEPFTGRRGRNGYNNRPVTISTAYQFIRGGPIRFSDRWDYYWVTPKGSSKEHGYVQGYGEMSRQTATLYELTGDEKVKQQALKMIRARAPWRVLGTDAEGCRELRVEAVVGWRHAWYPSTPRYGDPYLKAAAVLQDPVSVRLAQLYLEHNAIFGEHPRRLSELIVERVDNSRKVAAMAKSPFRFPMRDDQPDFAWADPGIKAVVFKHQGSKAWIVLGWRAAGINNLARIHFTRPQVDRIASVKVTTEYTPSGYTLMRPTDTNRRKKLAPGQKTTLDGEMLPIAEGPLAGMGDFYVCRYGDYLIAMNTSGGPSAIPSSGKTFTLDMPADLEGTEATELLTGKQETLRDKTIRPQETVLYYVGQ